jgi:NO-binding membrane sensor protein with MHYT domain
LEETQMNPSHEPWLVALSLFVAFQGSYVGLHLARQVNAAEGLHQRFLITAAALTLALGIWTMHFVGILAVRLPVAVDFLVLPTLLSFLVCVLVVGFAVFAESAGSVGRSRIVLAGVFMGAGIVAMHYLGMYALHASLHMIHAPLWLAASILVSVAASSVALWLGFGVEARGPVLLPAVLMGLAISAMHYSAMAGLTFYPLAASIPAGVPAFSPGLLAIVVSVVAFLVSGLFLLTLIPEEGRNRWLESRRTVAPPGLATQPAVAPAPEEAAPPESPADPPAKACARTLPVEKDGLQRQFEVACLVAVEAQAHYTQLFDGEALWFCPLSISEVEAALDPAVFARIHRSHIINLDRVSALKGTADAAVIAMTTRVPYRVPVSRARLRWLKQRLGERMLPAE